MDMTPHNGHHQLSMQGQEGRAVERKHQKVFHHNQGRIKIANNKQAARRLLCGGATLFPYQNKGQFFNAVRMVLDFLAGRYAISQKMDN
mmetsp:Transcript_8190/g.12738  ORF Transcript_8190/g.12738 Transcript_8190/m.12738 type:complete len:89 (+) Transcript_8190:710-976(+)